MKKLLRICLALSVLFMFVGVTFAAEATTLNGYVADSKCGAKEKTNAKCTKKCISALRKVPRWSSSPTMTRWAARRAALCS
jgi:hypothetical protein